MSNQTTQSKNTVVADTQDKKKTSNADEPQEATPVTASDAPEENSDSRLPDDNRPPHQMQLPTKDQD